jgi:hypothetical protein
VHAEGKRESYSETLKLKALGREGVAKSQFIAAFRRGQKRFAGVRKEFTAEEAEDAEELDQISYAIVDSYINSFRGMVERF